METLDHLAQVRNIGIAAHVDAGKTTLTERILFYTGASYKIGEVHDGNAHMDYLAEEQAHGITIMSAVTKATWQDHLIQLIDTPGHVDFTIEVERAMRVLDGCVIVLDGVHGVEPQTETVWRQRCHFQLPCLFFINKMDRPGADHQQALESIRKRLGAEPIAITLILPEQQAVIDLVNQTRIHFAGEQGQHITIEPCSPEQWAPYQEWRETLLFAIAETDDTLADQILAGTIPDADVLWQALRHATLAGKLYPCFAGAALRNLGVQPLLDGIVRLLPSPLDRPASLASAIDGSEQWISIGSGSLVALAFKVQLWDGRRHVFLRIYRGELHAGDRVAVLRADGQVLHEQIARLFAVDAGRKQRLDRAGSGEIVLVAGLRWTTTGDTLCDPEHPMRLERIEAQDPVLSLAIEPISAQDEDKLLEILDKLQQEDPTLKLEEDSDTGQRLLYGMGELHLQIACERLEREFHLQVRTGKPAVSLRETIVKTAQADVMLERQFEQHGKQIEWRVRIQLEVKPLARQSGLQLTIDPQIAPENSSLQPIQAQALDQGLHDSLSAGPLRGVALHDLAIRVLKIDLFGTLSTPEAIRSATAKAVRQALTRAGGLLLRPIMRVEVSVPAVNLGTVLGDLQARHALIRDTRNRGEQAVIHCEVALDRILGYTTELRSLTQGRGQFSLVFDRYDSETH